MFHHEDAIKKSEELIQEYMDTGFIRKDAIKACITGIKIMLRIGIYPGYQSLYQRTLNYLETIR